MTRLIYIAGYGRSGSTVLDAFLGQSLSASGGGELWRLFDEYVNGGLCSCGSSLNNCEVWGPTTRRALQSLSMDPEMASVITHSTEFGNRRSEEWSRLWSSVLDEYRTLTGSPTLVDSSKTSGGQQRLRLWQETRGVGERMVVVHLVRDPISVGASLYKGRNSQLAKEISPGALGRNYVVARGSIGWLRANVSAARFRDLGSRYVRVSYDSFVQDPHRLVETLETRGFTGNPGGSSVPHVVGGNRALHAAPGSSIQVRVHPAESLPRYWRPAMKGLAYLGARQGWL